MLPSVGRIWDFFKDECPQGSIFLYTTGEVWKKISPKLGGAEDWVEGLFYIDNTTSNSTTAFSEENSVIELANTLIELPDIDKILIISNSGKINVYGKKIKTTTSQNFISKIDFISSVYGDNRKKFFQLLELMIFNPEILEEIEKIAKD